MFLRITILPTFGDLHWLANGFRALRRPCIWTWIAATLVTALPAHAITKTWDGSRGIWSTATSWSPRGMPGRQDDITINAGVVTLTGNTPTGSLTFCGGMIATATYLLTINSTVDSECSAVISGTGAVTKEGKYTLTLTGANTYTGMTTVSAGTLALGRPRDGCTTGCLVSGSGLVIDNDSGLLVTSSNSHLTQSRHRRWTRQRQQHQSLPFNRDDIGLRNEPAGIFYP